MISLFILSLGLTVPISEGVSREESPSSAGFGYILRQKTSKMPNLLPRLSVSIGVLWTVLFVMVQLPHVAHSEAHPHQGVVTPFASGDPGVKLNGAALSTLRAGKPHKTQIESDSGGRGLVVQDVQAPPDVVWGRILDFNAYPKMVPKTAESQIYKKENLRKGQQRIWVRMKVGFPMLKIQFYINHLYDPAKNSLTWTLDYSKKSDLNDSVGFWYVIPHPDQVGHTRVYYSVEISVFDWMPKFVVDFLSKKALTDATAWVKKFSELEATKLGLGTELSTGTEKPQRKGLGGLVQRIFRKKEAVQEEDTCV